jgi:hypothetical protein
VALPTVIYGGYALLGFFTCTYAFLRTRFRAGHTHAGMMLLMALLVFDYLSQTRLSLAAKHLACETCVTGILTQSGGFFIHMAKGEEDRPSIGTAITSLGACSSPPPLGYWCMPYSSLTLKRASPCLTPSCKRTLKVKDETKTFHHEKQFRSG